MDAEHDEKTTGSRFLEEKLFQRRTILISGGITDQTARSVTERLLALSAESADPIHVYISSPVGHVESGDVIHDVIKFIRPEVKTIGCGWVASAGALIFVGAKKENRLCLPNTRFLLHQPSGGVFGKAVDIEIQAEQIVKMRERLNQIFAEATGQPIERIQKDTNRDFWMTPEEAIEYGLLGSVITSEAALSR
ncbi:MAG: ATP-dependent Clp protease proteolytic subunit [Pseudomonadota bacterium]